VWRIALVGHRHYTRFLPIVGQTMRRFPLFLILIAAGCGSSSSQTTIDSGEIAERPVANVNRHIEGRGGFSWIPPGNWELMRHSHSGYYISRGEETDGFAPNINISEEEYDGPVDAYLQASKAQLQLRFPEIEFVSESLATDLFPIAKLTAKNAYEPELVLRQVFYFLPAPERQTMYIMVCTQKEGAEDVMPQCDQSALSWQVEDFDVPKVWFNVEIPEDWNTRSHASLEYDMRVSPAGSSLIVVEEIFHGSLEDYLTMAIPQIADFTVQGRDVFPSAQGELVRVEGINQPDGSPEIAQRLYYLHVPSRESILVLICTQTPGADDMAACESAVGTLRVFAE